MEQIRESLDIGEPFDKQNILFFIFFLIKKPLLWILTAHSMAKTLTRLLESLGEPVIPFDNFDAVIECKDFAQAKTIISSLNPVHYNVFYYLMAFLRELLAHNK